MNELSRQIANNLDERMKDESFRKQIYSDPVLCDFYKLARMEKLDASTIVAYLTALSSQKLESHRQFVNHMMRCTTPNSFVVTP